MVQVEYRLKLGQDEFVIKADVKNEKEFFQKMSFYSNLPKTAPAGATDLKLVVRETKKGTYYSLVSEQEKLEFQLGQHKEGDTMYAKGWVPLYQAQAEQEGTSTMAAPVMAAPAVRTTQAAQVAAPVAAPVQFTAPAQVVQAPSQVAMPAPMPAPVAAPIQAAQVAAPAPAPASANPQVTQVANNVLARFGINK